MNLTLPSYREIAALQSAQRLVEVSWFVLPERLVAGGSAPLVMSTSALTGATDSRGGARQ